jgi:photosynthesis system II assembly factor YCF48-like protein/putative zinc finger protein
MRRIRANKKMEQLPKIVQRRLQWNPKPGVHPDPDLLAAFAEKSLHNRERSEVLQHLAECADCRDVLSLAMPQSEPDRSPSLETASWLSRPKLRWPRLRWPRLRWGALAACVVVVGAAVTLHYGPRQSPETLVAKKAPAAPASLTVERKVPEQPREKLASKIAPPSPFQSDRDLAVAAKLAKQSEKGSGAGIVASRTEVSALRALDQNDKLQELTHNRLANTVAANSADKPAPPAGALVAAAPAPLPPAKTAGAEPPTAESENKVRSDAADDSTRAATETLTVEAESASMPETAQSAERRAKDESSKNESQREVQAARGRAMSASAMGDRKADTLSAAVAQTGAGDYAKRSRAVHNPPRWTLSAAGVLERSFDSGKTWQTIQVGSNVAFRALAANDSDIWVGGVAGALYHSADGGQHWVQVNAMAEGKPLTADIVTIEFSDARHGKLTTGNRETWTTNDAGDTWQWY